MACSCIRALFTAQKISDAAIIEQMARLSKVQALSLVVLFLLHFSLQLPWSHGLKQSEPRQIYIVYLGERQHEDADLVTASHHDMLASVLGSKEEALESIVYSYKYGFSGFSARITGSQARKIQALPGVVSVRKNQIRRTHTTRSWDFLGMDYSQPNGLLARAKNGDDIIIGVIDTGIWPESQSFADDDSYGPPPSKWKGICQAGASFGPHSCNKKLIGVRWYPEGIDKSVLEGDFMSARDANGHGTHTASTAGGNIVHNVSFRGLAAGTARGGAPRARIAMYKVGWGADPIPAQSSDACVLKAIDDAIHDGVDVMSLSIGDTTEYPGTLHAVANGITVVFSAGNDGPTTQTVENSSPWLLTVAATTVDRQFPTTITLGNNQKLVGQSLFAAMEGANDDDEFHALYHIRCDNITATDIEIIHTKGVVVLCGTPNTPSELPPYEQIASVQAKNGGKGIIYTRYSTDGISSSETACNSLPCVAVDFEIYNQILQYFKQNTDSSKVKISFARTTIGTGVPAPKIAAFSSRGPSPLYPGVLKPDIAAPGVGILAAAPQIPLYKSLGAFYRPNSGTSMSCPHVSGIVAVLKSLHPDWSPAALKSALMTTALTTDNNGIPIQADGYRAKIADPFDYGAGFVNPIKAADPGLIYDISASDYLNFFNCMGGLGSNSICTTPKASLPDLNLPSIAIPNLKMSETIVRTVTNVGQPNAVYMAHFQPPAGVEMSVEPPVLVFCKETRVQSFKVTFKATRKIQGDYTFGSLAWHDGGDHWVRIPIAVRIIIEEFYSSVS